jgi:hypothetical protein
VHEAYNPFLQFHVVFQQRCIFAPVQCQECRVRRSETSLKFYFVFCWVFWLVYLVNNKQVVRCYTLGSQRFDVRWEAGGDRTFHLPIESVPLYYTTHLFSLNSLHSWKLVAINSINSRSVANQSCTVLLSWRRNSEANILQKGQTYRAKLNLLNVSCA